MLRPFSSISIFTANLDKYTYKYKWFVQGNWTKDMRKWVLPLPISTLPATSITLFSPFIIILLYVRFSIDVHTNRGASTETNRNRKRQRAGKKDSWYGKKKSQWNMETTTKEQCLLRIIWTSNQIWAVENIRSVRLIGYSYFALHTILVTSLLVVYVVPCVRVCFVHRVPTSFHIMLKFGHVSFSWYHFSDRKCWSNHRTSFAPCKQTV